MTQKEEVYRVRTDETPETFTIYRGGSPEDITGATLSLRVADSDGNFVFSAAGSVVSGPAGTCSFAISTANAAIAAGTYQFQVHMTLSSIPSVPTEGSWVVGDDLPSS